MTPWLSRELEGLAELALRLIGVFSTLDWERGSQEAKRPFLLGFPPPLGVLESAGLLGPGSGIKRHGKP